MSSPERILEIMANQSPLDRRKEILMAILQDKVTEFFEATTRFHVRVNELEKENKELIEEIRRLKQNENTRDVISQVAEDKKGNKYALVTVKKVERKKKRERGLRLAPSTRTVDNG